MKIGSAAFGLLVVISVAGDVCAQETSGGGSTAGFKRPANPPAHRKPIPSEAAGGKVEGSAAKAGSKAPSSAAAVGVEPGRSPSSRSEPRPATSSTASSARPSATPKPRGRLGGIGATRSGGGAKTTATQTDIVAGPPPIIGTTGTIDDVEEAIELGNAARDQKPSDYTEAERAYQLATKLAPDDWRAFVGLGNIYVDQDRDKEAIEPYRKAVELRKKSPEVFETLGDIYFRLGSYEESIQASSESVRLDATRPGPFWTLTWVSLALGRTEDAGNFADAFVYRWKPAFAGDEPYYVAFAGYVGYREAGNKEKAKALLAAPGESKTCLDANWRCRLLKYFRHEIKAEELMAEANTKDKMTEARTYIGIDLALSGHRAEALPHFQWVIESGNRMFVEYHLAKAWIAKLQKP